MKKEMDLTEKMIRYRAKHRLTQKQFAEMCGISQQTLCSVETGQQIPGKMTLAKIMLAMEEE